MPARGRRLLSSDARFDPRAGAAWRNRHRIIAFGSAALVALLVDLFVPRWLEGATRFAASYDAGILVLLGFFWFAGVHSDPRMTRARAALDDPGRNAVLIVIMLAVVGGLVAAIGIIGHGPHTDTAHAVRDRYIAYVLGVTAIFAGWVLVHTVYTFRYAHLYWYDDDGDGSNCGGIKFPETDEPSDWDFAYFSFCVGTSFAVSDPQVTETRVRREVIWHSIISFIYNSVIVGMLINLFAGIFSSGTGK
ncbi:MAG TPA: DUF1345 domain-containing protein [Candidatus Elarobacter sp.]